jgi:hypothetical protein
MIFINLSNKSGPKGPEIYSVSNRNEYQKQKVMYLGITAVDGE